MKLAIQILLLALMALGPGSAFAASKAKAKKNAVNETDKSPKASPDSKQEGKKAPEKKTADRKSTEKKTAEKKTTETKEPEKKADPVEKTQAAPEKKSEATPAEALKKETVDEDEREPSGLRETRDDADPEQSRPSLTDKKGFSDLDDLTEALGAPADTAGSELTLMAVDTRIDGAFNTGNSVFQGFLIPGLRLGVYGDATEQIGYAVALGQTREFSTVLLPQMLPVEAYVTVSTSNRRMWESRPRLSMKLGMATPDFNPWWSPDLKHIRLPSYFQSHKELFMDRDIGAQLTGATADDVLKFSIGVYNGNGILGLNTNNSKAFNANLEAKVNIWSSTLMVGLSAYSLLQSSKGSVNFRSNYATNAYLSLDMPALLVQGEIFFGGFEDNSGTVYPWGGAGAFILKLDHRFGLFARMEYLDTPPSSRTGFLRHFQAGPVLTLDKVLTIYTTYAYVEKPNGGVNNIAELRFRLCM